jgi:ferrous iron transport protein B
MARAGLSGKSFIPLLSSLACAVPGIMATRVIEDRRDRLATILVAPLMSCSARLPVYVLLIGAFLTDGYAWWVPGMVMFALYLLGLVLAPLIAFVLKKTLLRGVTPVFVMEMPSYKWPSARTVFRRVFDAAGSFLKRAGTVILASMILVWVLLNFPARDYPERIAALRDPVKEEAEQAKKLEEAKAKGDLNEEQTAELERLKAKLDPIDDEANALEAEWKRNSYLGQMGRAIEPAVKPLGWDWRVGVAALAAFPAREVVVGTLGILFQEGKVDSKDVEATKKLGAKLRDAKWEGSERPVFTIPVALSLMVFFALCCQCASTLAVIRRETRSWTWPAFTFAYMTALAYVAALVVYQVGSLFA